MGIIVSLIILTIIVIVHEIGHFVSAKLVKVKVIEFAVGFPPRLYSFMKWGTTFSINALLFGGYVKLLGEDDPSEPGSLASQSLLARGFVLFSGSAMNLLLPVLIFTGSYMIPHDEYREKVVVQEVIPDSPAYSAGIKTGDTIYTINGQLISNRTDVTRLVRLNLGNEILLETENTDSVNGLSQKRSVGLIPRWNPPPGEGAMGVRIKGENTGVINVSYPIHESISKSVKQCFEVLVLFRNDIASWFVSKTDLQVAGIVGIVQVTDEVAKAGFSPLLGFAALLSLNLAIVNLLPFPGLDGGRLFFLFLEAIRGGKRISPAKEGIIHYVGIALLILLALVITYNDLMRLIRGESLLP